MHHFPKKTLNSLPDLNSGEEAQAHTDRHKHISGSDNSNLGSASESGEQKIPLSITLIPLAHAFQYHYPTVSSKHTEYDEVFRREQQDPATTTGVMGCSKAHHAGLPPSIKAAVHLQRRDLCFWRQIATAHVCRTMAVARVPPKTRMDWKWPGNEMNDWREQLQWAGPEGFEMGSTWTPLTAQLGGRNRVQGRGGG